MTDSSKTNLIELIDDFAAKLLESAAGGTLPEDAIPLNERVRVLSVAVEWAKERQLILAGGKKGISQFGKLKRDFNSGSSRRRGSADAPEAEGGKDGTATGFDA